MVDAMTVEIFKLIAEKTITRLQLLQNIYRVFEMEIDFDVKGLLDNLIPEYQKLDSVEVTEKHN